MLIASFIMGVLIFFGTTFFSDFAIYGLPIKIITMAILVFGGLIIYCSLAFLFGVVKWGEFKQFYQQSVT